MNDKVRGAENSPPRLPRRGDTVEFLVAGRDSAGQAFGTLHERPAMLRRGGVPGDLVQARVLGRRRGAFQLALIDVLQASDERRPARCSHSEFCGGCTFQDWSYRAQLRSKQAMVERQLQDAGLSPRFGGGEILASPLEFRYRNKIDLTFGTRRFILPEEPEDAPRGPALGFHVAGNFEKVLDLSECHLAFAEAEPILATAKALMTQLAIPAWDLRTHTGQLRHLVLRKSFATGEILANLVTSSESLPALDEFFELWLRAHPEIASCVHTINSRFATVATGEEERIIRGPGFLVEKLLDLSFRISAASFFQTNSVQAARLFERVQSLICPRGDSGAARHRTVFDLYCGGGALSLVAAGVADRVVGFELVPSAVRDARANAALNQKEHLSFVEGDVLSAIQSGSMKAFGSPDVVLVDPPRSGLHPKVTAALCNFRAPRLVYVSCNPRQAVSDLRAFVDAGYELERADPVDMFPHTPHIECVFALAFRSEISAPARA